LENITINNFWIRNANIAAIVLPGEKEFYNTTFFRANEIETLVVPDLIDRYKEEQKKAVAGNSFLFNASPVFNFPVAGLMIPYKEFGADNCMIVIFSTENLQIRLHTSEVYTTYVVNNTGDAILDEDFEKLSIGVNRRDNPVVKDMLSSPSDNKQIKYKDSDGAEYFGAYKRLITGGVGVITIIPTKEITSVALGLIKQNVFLTIIVLLFSILSVYFFSKTISKPIRALNKASLKIEKGDYETDIVPTTRDEIGSLTENFIHMSKGLAERERIKSTFGKFVNKAVAEEALKGNLKLGGVRKEATIFFSDIRSFTAISESLTPEQVVEFLNDYMSRMVHCVNDTGGVVDKFIGDAIMALWGVPVSDGSPEKDAFNAVRAALMMRLSLIEFNKNRGTPDKPIIKIGCGLNTGPAIAGQIGSEQRMEYTVIGDAVNLASRIEALNKPFGCD
ncbi:MAG TPA: adenylate/guanylate cyclase domain-containing protein, partial [Spirochaetota bacterium]|nr:adenylate/guanylate cyclase domain-containing protein [Spirochaetota bacterium]